MIGDYILICEVSFCILKISKAVKHLCDFWIARVYIKSKFLITADLVLVI